MKPLSLVRWLPKLVGATALLIASATPAADVRVMISAAFYPAYAELGPVFERESGHHLITTRGPSLGDSPEAIPGRLKRGEPADAARHDAQLASWADRVVFLRDGRLVDQTVAAPGPEWLLGQSSR